MTNKKVIDFPKKLDDDKKVKVLAKAFYDISNEERQAVIVEYNEILEDSKKPIQLEMEL